MMRLLIAAALARAALSSWGVQPAVPLNYEQDPDCARLTGAMTYPLSFAFTSPYAVFALTTAQSPAYGLGLRVLGHSLDAHLAAEVPRFALALDSRPPSRGRAEGGGRAGLEAAGWTVCAVPEIRPRTPSSHAKWRHTFVKISLFNYTAFEKVLFLDADTLAVGDLAPLFRHDLSPEKPMAAVRDIRGGHYVETFNTGVWLVRPDAREFQRLARLLETDAVDYEVTMTEQGWLNAVFQPAGRWARLPDQHAANLAIYGKRRRDWDAFAHDLRVVHYTMQKPFLGQGTQGAYRDICDTWRAVEAGMGARRAAERELAKEHAAVLVTGYWPLRSKHPSASYDQWIGNFLEVPAPLVAFAGEGAAEAIWVKRAALGHDRLTRVVRREVEDFHSQRAFGAAFARDFGRDREARRHRSPRLYAVWSEKLELVEIARRRRFFGGGIEAIFWLDIGIFRRRDRAWRLATAGGWPARAAVERVVATGRVAITEVQKFAPADFAPGVDNRFEVPLAGNRVCGCAFGGSGAAARRARHAYYDMTRQFVEADVFAGKDQSVWNMMHARDQSIIELVDPSMCAGVNRWFALIMHLATSCGTQMPPVRAAPFVCGARSTTGHEWTHYRLADVVARHSAGRYDACLWPQSIACDYTRTMGPRPAVCRPEAGGCPDMAALDGAVRRYLARAPQAPPGPEELVWHLRVGDTVICEDAFARRCPGNTRMDAYLRKRADFDEVLKHLPPGVRDVTLVYALFHEPCRAIKVSARNPELGLRRAWSQRYADDAASYLRSRGYRVRIRADLAPDADMAYLCRAKHFARGGGGYSDLGARCAVELNGGTVYPPLGQRRYTSIDDPRRAPPE